ncbi:MAG TPA: aspartyl protease family protein [Pedobacter sp.]|uniref:retropepsin-like aspartic protease n=1 Tax=Pedobacter sp. TaxID=1411316 RepID=UPI002BF68216|nr:aspartyl protease family protein [Pedobacter sp.]HMI02971.1 aspartyl protease family protein [Pedobacter sp.]
MSKLPEIKTLFAALLLSFTVISANAQGYLSLNSGGTSQKNYFTEIDYDNTGGSPVVKVTLGGKTYRFLLDTGAPNVISKAVLRDITPANFNPDTVRKAAIWDASGKVDSLSIITVSGITLGNVVFNDVPTLIAKDQFVFDCDKFDGIIGSNMLRNSIVRFSSKEHKITLTDQPEKLNLNNKPSSVLYLNQTQSTPLVITQMKDKGSVNLPMVFDTGDSRFFSIALQHYALCENQEIFTVLGKSKGSTGVSAHGIEKDTTTYRLRTPEVSLNGAVFKNVNVQTTPAEDSRIGSELLNYGTVTLDYINKKFYFEPFQSPLDLYAGSFPVTLAFKNNKVAIGMLWDQELKDRINVGDQVISVDDQDYTRFSLCDLVKASKFFDAKNRVNLTLKGSDGKIRKVILNRQ